MRCFLLITNIDKIGLCTADIKMHFYYFIFYMSQKYFNILNCILYIEKLAISQVIIVNKSVMT